MTDAAVDQYSDWRKMMAGEQVPILAEKPLPGFYRTRRPPGPWLPVAIWDELGELVAQKGRKEVPVGSVWPWCAATPISFEDYNHALEHGFPDEKPATKERATEADPVPGDEPVMASPPLISTGEERIDPEYAEPVENGRTPAIGHNSPPDDMALTKEELQEAIRQAEAMAKAGQAQSDEDETAGNALIAKLQKAGKAVYEHRRKLKQPLEAEIKAIDSVWMPLEKNADTAVGLIKQKVTGPYLAAKRAEEDRRRQEEARRKREEAERAAAEAAAAQSEDAEIAAERARQEAAQAERAASAKSKVSSGGGATKMRKVTVASVTDAAAFAAFLLNRDQPDEQLLQTLQTLANRMVAAGAHKLVDIPGIKVSEETRFV